MRYVDTARGRLSHKLRDGKYRARLAGCEYEPFTLDDACSRLLADNKCYYCGVELDLAGTCGYGAGGYTLEHIIPLVRKGPHALGNLAKACAWCNQEKRIQDELDFLAFLDQFS